MRVGRTFSIAALALVCLAAPIAEGAIINASNRRRAKTAATVRIATTTSGQRLIVVKIDPPITTAFQLDLAYDAERVTPLGVPPGGGFGAASDASGAVTFFAPYQGLSGGVASLIQGIGGSGGVISNVEGRYVGPAFTAAAPPQANRPDGASDLFEVAFVDLAPDQPKTFTVLGVDPLGGVDALYESFVADNFLDIYVDDPADPMHQQRLHYDGGQIESFTLVVPAADGNGANGVPLPPALFAGALSVGAAWMARRRFVR